jgi:hypothetical protein
MASDLEQLLKQSEQLFSKRSSLLSLWQTIADNFYPERADFTTVRNMGEEFASNLYTSYPILARRDLGNAIGSMLRPSSKKWFHVRTSNYDKLDQTSKAWLEMAGDRMRRAMHNRKTQFARATKEADHDFSAFGQNVLQVSPNKDASGMLYRCWHLRDCAWVENADGIADTVFRRWKLTAIELKELFPSTIHRDVAQCVAKEPYKEFNVQHCILPAEHYVGEKKWNTPYVSVFFDVDNKHLLEERGLLTQEYVIARWSTVSGSQYAYSPATVAALPDSRLIQAMTRTLLEAGEKAVTPPMIAVQEALRGDISLYAGGVNWVDAAYDERLGEVLRPLTQDQRGLPNGLNMQGEIRAMIAEAFFLNKLALPPPGQDMTAFEVGQRVQEYIRQALPLFEPMESEYNHPLCDKTFDIMMRRGAFGSHFDIPEGVRGAEVEFSFESPLHDAVEREKGQRFLEANSMLAQAVQLDPTAADILDSSTALRDVLEGIGVPAKWTRSESVVANMANKRMQDQRTAEMLAQMQAGADVAKTLGEAGKIAPPGALEGAAAALR